MKRRMRELLVSMTLLGLFAVSSAFAQTGSFATPTNGNAIATPSGGGASGNWLINVTAVAADTVNITVTPDVGAKRPNVGMNTLTVILLDRSSNPVIVEGGSSGVSGTIVGTGPIPWLTPASNGLFYGAVALGSITLDVIVGVFSGLATMSTPAVSYVATIANGVTLFTAGAGGIVPKVPGQIWSVNTPTPIGGLAPGVPEPGTLALLIPGLASFGLVLLRRRGRSIGS